MAIFRIFGGRDEPRDSSEEEPKHGSDVSPRGNPVAGPPSQPTTPDEAPRPATADDLESLCQSNISPRTFAEAVGKLSESDRKRLSSPVQEIYKAAQTGGHDRWHLPTHQNGLAKLALLACGPWSQVKRLRPGRLPVFPRDNRWLEAVQQILQDRRPDWAEDWINLQLEIEEPWGDDTISLDSVHELVRAGVIRRPTVDGYVRLLVRDGPRGFDPVRDADLLETGIWRLFEVDTDAFGCLGNLKDADLNEWRQSLRPDPRGPAWEQIWFWPRRLCYWTHQGKLDRNRLIDATLAALWRDFHQTTRNGLVQFLGILELTDDEIAAREAAHRDLLRNDHNPALGLALDSLKRLAAINRLDVAAFLDCVAGCFAVADQRRAKTALSLIERVAKEHPEHQAEAVRAVCGALNHEKSAIQDQAVKLLEKWKSKGASFDENEITRSAALVDGQHRRRLESIAGSSKGAEAHGASDSQKADLDRRREAVLARLAALPEWVRVATGLVGIERAIEHSELPPAFHPDPTACPVLSGVEPLCPLDSLDELIDAAAHLFKIIESPAQIERVVDGILRLGRQMPEDFDVKTAGVHHAITHLTSSRLTGEIEILRMGRNLVRLIGRWLGTEVDFSQSGGFWNPGAHDAFDQRMALYLTRIRTQQFGPVLATPTHCGGWIDPRTFVDRLKSLRDPSRLTHRLDLIAGLLRLAPDFRAEALQNAADLPEPPGRLVRYALGGDERPTAADRDTADEWLAAGRARNPRGVLEELKVLGFGDREPNVITPVAFEFDARVTPADVKETQLNRSFVTQCIDWTPDAIVREKVAARPTVEQVLLVPNGRDWHFHRDWDDELAASQWPLNSDATLATACCQLMARLDDKPSVLEPVAGLLSPLRAVDRGWSEMARTALWLGLVSRSEPAQAIALDAFIEGIADGRADPQALGETLVHIDSGGWVKTRRLIGSLRAAIHISVLAERVVAVILERLIGSWDAYPREASLIMTLLLELLKNMEQGPSPGVREVLVNLEAEGTTARLAREIMALEANPQSPALRQSALDAAEGRLTRAERIAQYAAAR